jgi:hypothetical protein
VIVIVRHPLQDAFLLYDFNFNILSGGRGTKTIRKGINSVGGWLMVIQVFIFLNAYDG